MRPRFSVLLVLGIIMSTWLISVIPLAKADSVSWLLVPNHRNVVVQETESGGLIKFTLTNTGTSDLTISDVRVLGLEFVVKSDYKNDIVSSVSIPTAFDHCSGKMLGTDGTCTLSLLFGVLDSDPTDKHNIVDSGIWLVGVRLLLNDEFVAAAQSKVKVTDRTTITPEPGTLLLLGTGLLGFAPVIRRKLCV